MKYLITKEQAKRFLLLKHGLIGDYLYKKQQDLVKFVDNVTCIQYDPVDVCGKNAELVLQSRFPQFEKEMLSKELYERRSLIDYFDKNVSIYQITDWPYFKRIRDKHRVNIRNKEELEPLFHEIEEILEEKEFISSKDLDIQGKVDWYWSETTKARALLEQMYFNGDLVIHHRSGAIRYFSLTRKLIDKSILDQEDPHQNEIDYLSFRLLRRIRSVGLLWNKPSDAFIYMQVKANERKIVFEKLINEEKIIEVDVEGIKSPLYMDKDFEPLLQEVLSGKEYQERFEFIAPLDNLMWDRSLIKAIFDFEYKWEIYTPEVKRKFGYYVLPVIYGTNFIGRIEIEKNSKTSELIVKNFWLEKNVKLSKTLENKLNLCLERFRKFNKVNLVRYCENYLKYNPESYLK